MFGGLALALMAVGTGIQFIGLRRQNQANIRAEEARKTQVKLESMRSRRQIIRNAILGRSMALANATNQGAGRGSGVAGGMASTVAQGATNLAGVNAAETLSMDIFGANMDAFRGATLASFGAGLSSLGSAIGSIPKPGSQQ